MRGWGGCWENGRRRGKEDGSLAESGPQVAWLSLKTACGSGVAVGREEPPSSSEMRSCGFMFFSDVKSRQVAKFSF